LSLPPPERVGADFEAMAAAGINSLRTYEPPPLWLLDMAQAHGLKVMVGLAWEQHVAFLDDPERADAIVARVAAQVRACEAHPAILCYAVGNEIPAPIVRWHGKREVERFIERLYWEAKAVDPDGLVTYVNYPSTEYLELPFLDLTSFNVFLEDERTFESYLARLQNLSGDRPLLITEVGIDSRRNGEAAQAKALEWQVRHAFGTGAAGVFVFSWTDEWHRGGHDVTDWDFGLVDRERRPKPALAAIRSAFAAAPFAAIGPWPRPDPHPASGRARALAGRGDRAPPRRLHQRRPLAQLRIARARGSRLRPARTLDASAVRAACPRQRQLRARTRHPPRRARRPRGAAGARLGPARPARGRRQPPVLRRVRARLEGRALDRQERLRKLAQRLVQRSQRLLPGQRPPGGGSGDRLQRLPAGRRGSVGLRHNGRSGGRDRRG
jgi:hypothetical protein